MGFSANWVDKPENYLLRYVHGGCAECADGVLDLGEGCDDGNSLAGDTCDATCRVEPRGVEGCGQSNVPALNVGGEAEFRFSLVAAGMVDLQTTGLGGECAGDTLLELYDSNGLLDVNDNGDDDCSRLKRELDPGDYRVVVRQAAGGNLGPFVFRHGGEILCGSCGNHVREGSEECDDGEPFFAEGGYCAVACNLTTLTDCVP